MTLVRARVSAVHRSALHVLHAGVLHPATLSPALARDLTPLAHPGVGDWVAMEDVPGLGWRISSVEPRRSAIVRRAAGSRAEPQLLAANVDLALLFAAFPDDVNPRRLARLAALAWDGGCEPLILLSRVDLANQAERTDALRAVASHLPGIPCLAISAITGEGLEELGAAIHPESTVVLLGPSGAGKSTLINRLAGHEVMRTGATRADGAGRHTTTHRALIELPGDVTVIDTPGLREVGMWVGTAGSDSVFPDIVVLGDECRFSDCTHEVEPGCAVRDAVARGTIDPERFAQWLQLQHEARRAERSVQQQRQLERQGSRAMRQIIEQRKKRD